MSFNWDFTRSYAENEAAMNGLGTPAPAPAAQPVAPAPPPQAAWGAPPPLANYKAPEPVAAPSGWTQAFSGAASNAQPMPAGGSWGGAAAAMPSGTPAPTGMLGSVFNQYAPTAQPQPPGAWADIGNYGAPQMPTPTPKPTDAGATPTPKPAPTGGQNFPGVTNYLFEYPDGTRGNSPNQRDANGNIIVNAAGGVTTGKFLGRTMEDGSINQSPIGNVTADGRVWTYGGYSTDADNYYSDANAAAWGRSNNVGPKPTAGYGYETPGAQTNLKPPMPVGPGGGQGGAGGAGGSGGAGGTGGSSSSSSSSTTNTGAPTTRAVDAGTETIEGRIKNILATDANGNYTNPLIQQAASSAMQQFAGRGLLNSSMANEAAMQAAMSKAIEIAGPDAQTYFAQGRANQDAANVFERDARGYAQENSRLDKQMNFDADKFDRELQYRYDALKIDKESQTEARALAQKYAIEMEDMKSVNSAYELYLRRISDIDANTEYSAETKVKLKNEAGKDFDLYAKTKRISGDMNLGNRFTSSAPAPDAAKPPAAPAPESGAGN